MEKSRINAVYDFPTSPLWEAIEAHYRSDETTTVEYLCQQTALPSDTVAAIQADASTMIQTLREAKADLSVLELFLAQYSLSSDEGVALMCLAEALLRIPDPHTVDKLIQDKLSKGNWREHFGQSDSLFVNAATFGLMLTGKMTQQSNERQAKNLNNALTRLMQKGGDPIVRKAIAYAMKILGKQFVMGKTAEAALKRADTGNNKDFTYSFDMLGEVALTQKDADHYYARYEAAIDAIATHKQTTDLYRSPGISVKLSALTPRFQLAQYELLSQTLYPRLKALVLKAKAINIGLTLDAEESQTLIMLLQLSRRLFEEGVIGEWEGFGIVVQAYQKRAPYVIDWLADMAKTHRFKMMVRLVKGAYWDSEIKQAQVQGLSGYPVFTRKKSTDLSYQYCAQKLLAVTDLIYPQFATHNAYTVAMIQTLAQAADCTHYEFQRLHGMGEGLYQHLMKTSSVPCRVYAPVGTHQDLLSYLVRRLLENGANTSFVNRLVDEKRPVESLVADPREQLMALENKPHTKIVLPEAIYLPERKNSQGLDLSDPMAFMPVLQQIATMPAVPTVTPLTSEKIVECIKTGDAACQNWQATPVSERANLLNNLAKALEENRTAFMQVLIKEAGKTIDDALNEVREAIDFCYYYASEAIRLSVNTELKGPTGEDNRVAFFPRGLMLCISPWNFPLAIFLGQVAANLAAGNTVLAKPATQTMGIAAKTIDLMHSVGFPKEVIQLLPCRGKDVSNAVLPDRRIQGVVFTGSTETAQIIQQKLAERGGAIVPLIAETGGINAMIVDASALPEQVIQDVVLSAFKSAGQRCSALRVLLVQEDVADKMIEMLKGAMAALKVGDPMALSTDVGPVIDAAAKEELLTQIAELRQNGQCLYECALSSEAQQSHTVAPIAFEIADMTEVKSEIFGPVLQVVRYPAKALPNVIAAVNDWGYGLTFGIHSRINNRVAWICEQIKVGNIYVNRSMTGAVVGVQPFGGEGLSGTGPKAGGAYYLPRMMVERAVSINTMAQGGNTTLYTLESDD